MSALYFFGIVALFILAGLIEALIEHRMEKAIDAEPTPTDEVTSKADYCI